MQLPYEEFQRGLMETKFMTNITKYHSFQYRLLQNAVVTNTHLQRWGMFPHNRCTFCHEQPETYNHLFIFCKYVQELWMQVEIFMNEFSMDQINFQLLTVYWNKLIAAPIGHIKNFICLVTKQYIYKQRCLNKVPRIRELRNIVN